MVTEVTELFHVAYADRPGRFFADRDVALRVAEDEDAQFVQERFGDRAIIWGKPRSSADLLATREDLAAVVDRVGHLLGLPPESCTSELVVAYVAKRSGTLAAALATVHRRAEWLRQALDAPEDATHGQLLAEVARLRAVAEQACRCSRSMGMTAEHGPHASWCPAHFGAPA